MIHFHLTNYPRKRSIKKRQFPYQPIVPNSLYKVFEQAATTKGRKRPTMHPPRGQKLEAELLIKYG